MASKADDKAPIPPVEDSRDALEVLEAEAKEWEKDAEINRILQAFRLDAYVQTVLSTVPLPKHTN
jgi:DnaJ family protein C protein 8